MVHEQGELHTDQEGRPKKEILNDLSLGLGIRTFQPFKKGFTRDHEMGMEAALFLMDHTEKGRIAP